MSEIVMEEIGQEIVCKTLRRQMYHERVKMSNEFTNILKFI